MITTQRDHQIIEFLSEYRVASTSTLKDEFFPSLRACQLRLQKLTQNNKVKRVRLTMNNDYVYYVRRPKQYMHSLLITEFYRELKKHSNVLKFSVQRKLGKIVPDAILGFEIDGKQRLGLLEVEISNKGFDFDKYDEFHKSLAYKDFFPIMPTVFIVGKNIRMPQNSKIKYVLIKPDMSDFRLE